MSNNHRIERGSGNVFADLDLPNPETALLKADLALHIERAIEASGWTDDQAARELHVRPETIVAITRGSLGTFSTDELLRMLQLLNFDVNIVIGLNESPRRPARIAVHRPDEFPRNDLTISDPIEEASKQPGRAPAPLRDERRVSHRADKRRVAGTGE